MSPRDKLAKEWSNTNTGDPNRIYIIAAFIAGFDAHMSMHEELVEELVEVVSKVNALLKCEDGLLSATGKCNDLLCELLNLVPANVLAKAEGA